MEKVRITECPRDAMQGLSHFIPTEVKINYLNHLLKTGFDTLDFGSFVSPKAIPQLRDTEEVIDHLELNNSKTKLLAIIANLRGAETACSYQQISYLGFPFSISETFQQRNTNSSIATSLQNVEIMQELCVKNNKKLLVYISMAFGNPYGDVWNSDIALKWIDQIASLGVTDLALADTVGVAQPNDIEYLFKAIIPEFSNINFAAHLHSTPENWKSKVDAAFNSGCRSFDSAIRGFGGCPMAEDELVGNLATENLISFLDQKGIALNINREQFSTVFNEAAAVFNMADAT